MRRQILVAGGGFEEEDEHAERNFREICLQANFNGCLQAISDRRSPGCVERDRMLFVASVFSMQSALTGARIFQKISRQWISVRQETNAEQIGTLRLLLTALWLFQASVELGCEG